MNTEQTSENIFTSSIKVPISKIHYQDVQTTITTPGKALKHLREKHLLTLSTYLRYSYI